METAARWKNRGKTNCMFSHRFPTALGKLGKKQQRRVSHSSHSFYGKLYIGERGKRRNYQNPKPDMSLATKSGHFNLLQTNSLPFPFVPFASRLPRLWYYPAPPLELTNGVTMGRS